MSKVFGNFGQLCRLDSRHCSSYWHICLNHQIRSYSFWLLFCFLVWPLTIWILRNKSLCIFTGLFKLSDGSSWGHTKGETGGVWRAWSKKSFGNPPPTSRFLDTPLNGATFWREQTPLVCLTLVIFNRTPVYRKHKMSNYQKVQTFSIEFELSYTWEAGV